MLVAILAAFIGLVVSPVGIASAAPDDLEPVGLVTAAEGTVTMQSATRGAPVPLRPYDQVGPLAVFETQAGSRCKVLYTDDSLITIGEHSRLEIAEQTYRAGSDTRAFVAHLGRGSVRALIGRIFEGANSVFEIHTGTAVARARGTYFVLWSEKTAKDSEAGDGRSGVANIGRSGDVAFTSGGATVLVLPGQFSVASSGAPPTMPTAISTGVTPLASAISGTVLAESPKPESPRAALAAAGIGATGATGVAAPSASLGIVRADALGGQAPSGSYMVPTWPFPVTPVTPPAVVSGAVPITTTINLIIQLP
jgi:hypothetical protein